MYAIVETGGKQYRIAQGDKVRVEKLDAAVGDKVELPVLMTVDGKTVKVGEPTIKDVFARAQVLAQDKDKKIVVFHYKSKKDYRKKAGHRQPFTELCILGIGDQADIDPAKEAEKAKADAKAAAKKKADEKAKAEKAAAKKTEAKPKAAPKKDDAKAEAKPKAAAKKDDAKSGAKPKAAAKKDDAKAEAKPRAAKKEEAVDEVKAGAVVEADEVKAPAAEEAAPAAEVAEAPAEEAKAEEAAAEEEKTEE